MAALQEYKCPCCGGAVAFDPGVQKMKCPYCDAEFEMDALQSLDEALQEEEAEQLQWDAPAGGEWSTGDAASVRTYLCRSCGGEILADATTAASTCPFCGNRIVMTDNLRGALKPDLVIPFKLDREAAVKSLEKHLQGKRLLPAVFRDSKHISEVQGVYVPFWFFDADADASIRYKTTRQRKWTQNDTEYTETKYYSVLRSGTLSFADVPVRGSSKLAQELMESIEPFDMTGAVPFQTAYLAGYVADKYDVSEQDSIARANERIKTSTEQCFAETLDRYDSVETESNSVRLSSGKAKYALCPVWLLNTEWNGQNYVFAMNGQTGKFVGDLPLDKAASRRWLLGITAACTAAITAVSFLIWLL